MKTSTHYLFRNLTVVDPRSPHNGQVCDMEVLDGTIVRIAKNITAGNALVIDESGQCVAPGIFDMQVSCGEPGEEEKETFSSLNHAAIAGGVTGLLLMPSSHPASDNRGQIEYILKNTEGRMCSMYPAGALSVGLKGTQLAEMADMHAAGALAFTDDKSPVSNSILVHLAMQYNQIAGGLLLFHAEDASLSLGGKVNEGTVSVQLGMKGAPSIGEELGVVRLLTLARYHHARIHIQGISSEAAVSLIRAAKKEGVQVTCSTYAHLLYFTDEALMEFDSRFKVWPPLRSQSDRAALRAGVEDGTIDVISSDHRPETIENKDVEFDYATNGTIGLESLWSASFSAMQGISTDVLIERLSHAPRRILGMPAVSISEGAEAHFFLYNPDASFTFTSEHIRSKSANSAFLDQTLHGKITGTFTASTWLSS